MDSPKTLRQTPAGCAVDCTQPRVVGVAARCGNSPEMRPFEEEPNVTIITPPPGTFFVSVHSGRLNFNEMDVFIPRELWDVFSGSFHFEGLNAARM